MDRTESGERIGLQGWVERIRDRDMPVFGRTVQEVKAVTADENASTGVLSRAILKDPALTAKVLKLANSAMLNPSRQSVNTVSRAIVVLGFDLVGQIVLSIALVDALLSGGLRSRVAAEMARCFHAAVQARTAAQAKGSDSPEEVFIAALLGRVGELAFWCFGGDLAAQLDAAMQEQPDERPEDLQVDLLGFRLRSLSAALAKEWRLGPLVTAASELVANPTSDQASIALGYRLAHAVEGGWESPEAVRVLREFADFSGRPVKELTEELVLNATEASRVAAQFGAAEAARLIPVPASGKLVDIAAEMEPPEESVDPLLQLKILRDLAMLLTGSPSLNDVLQLVLEGIFRGLGMSRAVFALMTPDRKKLAGKVALGRGAEEFSSRFVFALDGREGDVVNLIVAAAKPLWLKNPAPPNLKIDRLVSVTGQKEAYIAPIVATGRVIGLFYADRLGSPLDEDTWQGFLHFAHQASLSFEHVANRGAVRK